METYIKGNTKYPYSLLTDNIRVSVKTNFLDEQSDTNQNLWVWAYHILIENNRNEAIQLIDRYWEITDETGHIQEVKGSGVIGLQPIIEPKKSFQYSSGTPLSKPSGFMKGEYNMICGQNKSLKIIIPTFSLDSPFKKVILN
ncbi:MAG: Co2+/Mg2+ efflux protein ApaG [Pelagibacterales bacterium]|nr:Co2+/Mg2+ efflux protein ApaG [Pelagibacterales bacterium]PPR16322.1 MAG: Protein ApaG [Alphaproteobacteria bacterium MarineAlpha9_Bin3]|tara:strand:- start:1251 stop:1676 length:426 start_codon:yes stop_codon:yes gene_type:complete